MGSLLGVCLLLGGHDNIQRVKVQVFRVKGLGV